LIGAFIATLGLPPLSPVQEQFRIRLDTLFGASHGYADLVPGLQKVVQAAGRVLRSPEDRGWLWLMDDRYRRPGVRALLPGWWRISEGSAAPRTASAACASGSPPP
jgi:Rad3-related DNA helicase